MGALNLVLWLVIGAFWTFYATSFLMLEEKVSHYGPFPSNKRRINWSRSVDQLTGQGKFYEYTAPVTWFDWFRRLFGVYAIAKEGDGFETWYVKESRAEVWTCPKCLSFWLALVPTLGYMLTVNLGIEVLFLPFAFAGASFYMLQQTPYVLPMPMGVLSSTGDEEK